MISNQGFLVVYDCAWSLAKSPTMKPSVNAETASKYTKEQIHMEQIQYLLDTFIDDDFVEQKEISCLKTRVYRKGESAYF